MESIVFANSPLAEYLEGAEGHPRTFVDGLGSHQLVLPGNGQSAADWGIEPPDDSPNTQQSFAPSLSFPSKPRHSKVFSSSPPATPGSDRKARFYELFSKAVDSRLSRRENSRFLERFRYIIVASQLLNGHVNVSHYDRKIAADHLFSEDDSPGSQYARARYWAGSGGFVLAVTLLVSWVWRGGISKGKAITALFVSIMVAVVLFADARRRWLRSLRAKAIELAAVFVENSQAFDILASTAVTLIQEVELVSRGYRLSAPLPPVTRLDRDSQNRRCARLRKSILSALNLCIPPHAQACTSLRDYVHELDLEKYFDIYDIQSSDLEEAELAASNEEAEDMESLKALKSLLHRLHTIRRIFLCCLLAFDTDGRHADYTKWKLVVERLRTLGSIVGELTGELKRIMEEEERFPNPPTPKSPAPQENDKCRAQLRKLNSLSQALRGLQAKMHVLREESDRSLQDSTDFIEFGPEMLAHYDSIGADLRALVDEWENGRANLMMCMDRQDRASSGSPPGRSPESISGTTLAGDTPRNSGLFSKDTWADITELRFSPQNSDDGRLDEEEVFEAIAEPRPRSSLTREERIRKVQEERAKIAERRKTAEAGLALQKELQQVLVNRPPPRRRRVVSASASTLYYGRNYT